jgi:hypothetical protein
MKKRSANEVIDLTRIPVSDFLILLIQSILSKILSGYDSDAGLVSLLGMYV